MGDTDAKRPAGGAHRVNMNPLVITRGFGKQIDALLADGQPLGATQVQALGLEQRLGTAENMTHGPLLRLVGN
ncbi:hypothetical protein D3C85_1320600 [compost metagenome]